MVIWGDPIDNLCHSIKWDAHTASVDKEGKDDVIHLQSIWCILGNCVIPSLSAALRCRPQIWHHHCSRVCVEFNTFPGIHVCVYRDEYQWIWLPLQWRHNGLNGVSNHQPHDCLLCRLFRRKSKETSKLRVIGLCGEFTGDRWILRTNGQ